MKLRDGANAVAATLAEVGEAPEGILYAGLMTKGATLAKFEAIRTFLIAAGLAEEAPGPMLIATPRLKRLHKLATEQAKPVA